MKLKRFDNLNEGARLNTKLDFPEKGTTYLIEQIIDELIDLKNRMARFGAISDIDEVNRVLTVLEDWEQNHAKQIYAPSDTNEWIPLW